MRTGSILWPAALALLCAASPARAETTGEGGHDLTAAARIHRAGAAQAADQPAPFPPEGELYVVGTAHLDTQWRWTVRETIQEYLPATLRENFELFRKYPDYTFSFEGAFRYMLMKEYYPAEYQELKEWIRRGRWRVCGSWVDAVDTNIPSPESLIRQTLYGNGFFRREFGRTSRDVFLPDCFGFGYALPSIAAHCGLLGFSTQKLAWGSSVGTPFDVGLWEGVDGSRLVAALNPGAYVSRIGVDLGRDSTVAAVLDGQEERSGLRVGFKYFGTGDTGGSPTDESVDWLERSIRGRGPVRVKSAAADQLARDIASRLSPERISRLPLYKGEFLMTDHGTGCYTSQAEMKRLNRKNEKLADAAERISVLAHCLGLREYPKDVLGEAWIRFLWHQFHDDLTGTSIPEAYAYSWNDERISENQFAGVLTDAAGAVAGAMDTEVSGIPLLVYNPLSIEREDIVEAEVRFDAEPREKRGPGWGRGGNGPRDGGSDGTPPRYVRVFDPSGKEVPSQSRRLDGSTLQVTFLARVPSVGCAVFEVRPSDEPCRIDTGLRAGGHLLENPRYRVRLDEGGRIASIRDKRLDRELLSSPIESQLLEDTPPKWAAWELSYDDVVAAPKAVVRIARGPRGDTGEVRLLEDGPARASLEVIVPHRGSLFRQTIRLGAGDAGDRLEVDLEMDWAESATMLKAAFPLAIRDRDATYDLGLGTIRRLVDHQSLYEVPAQQWADLSDPGRGFGVAVLTDSRTGWDRPDESTLRLTLVRTPEVHPRWNWIKDQRSMDWGRHRTAYALYAHAGDWREGVSWQAERLNQPMRAFQVPRRRGSLGRRVSLLEIDSPGVALQALKVAEDGEEIIVRVRESRGREAVSARLTSAIPLLEVRELNGAEEPLGDGSATGDGPDDRGLARLRNPHRPPDIPARLTENGLVFSLQPYELRTFALRCRTAPPVSPAPSPACLSLPYNARGFTPCSEPNGVDLDGRGHSFPLELMPRRLTRRGVPFAFAGPSEQGPNLLLCQGQQIRLPEGEAGALFLLAASTRGDRRATFVLDGRPVQLWIQDATEPIGQWDSRLMAGRLTEEPSSIVPAYLKEDPVAWVATHLHRIDGARETYAFGILYLYRIDLPSGARVLTLPRDPAICLAAATVLPGAASPVRAATPLHDRPKRTAVRIEVEDTEFLDSTRVTLHSPNRGAVLRYTLDGKRPDADSPLYRGPFSVDSSCAIRARAFLEGMDDRFVAGLPVTRLQYLAAVEAAGARPGLVNRTYEGVWEKLPDFSGIAPTETGVLSTTSLARAPGQEDYGQVLEGLIRVERDGLYIFHLFSDDGSALDLHGRRLIDNDGLHGRGEATGRAALKAGLHPLRVEFFQRGGGSDLELWLEGPGMPLREVSADELFHLPEHPGGSGSH